jgi:hypothetical protein
MKKMMITAALFGLAFPLAAQAKPLKHGGHTKETGVSGYTGKKFTHYNLNSTGGITGIKFTEAADKPCVFWKVERDLDDVTGKNKTGSQVNLRCKGTVAWGLRKAVYFSGDRFVHAIKVCTTNHKRPSRRRIKGIKIYAARVQSSPVKVTPKHDVTSTAKRPHCKKWHKKVSCGDRRIAYGFIIHQGDYGASGIALKCTDLMVKK